MGHGYCWKLAWWQRVPSRTNGKSEKGNLCHQFLQYFILHQLWLPLDLTFPWHLCTTSTSKFTTVFQDHYSLFSLPPFGEESTLPHPRELPAVTHIIFAAACKMKLRRWYLAQAVSAKNPHHTSSSLSCLANLYEPVAMCDPQMRGPIMGPSRLDTMCSRGWA